MIFEYVTGAKSMAQQPEKRIILFILRWQHHYQHTLLRPQLPTTTTSNHASCIAINLVLPVPEVPPICSATTTVELMVTLLTSRIAPTNILTHQLNGTQSLFEVAARLADMVKIY